MWGKIIIPMYRLWLNGLYGLYGPRCPLSSKRPINLISLSYLYNGNPYTGRMISLYQNGTPGRQGPPSQYKDRLIYVWRFLRMAISMLKIRRSLGRLIFNMGIAIPGKTVFLIETAPRYLADWGCNTLGPRQNGRHFQKTYLNAFS